MMNIKMMNMQMD